MTPSPDPNTDLTDSSVARQTLAPDSDSRDSEQTASAIGGWISPLARDAAVDSATDGSDETELFYAGAGRYDLLDQIACGGMGLIVRGYDRDLNRELALKILRPDLAGRPANERRFVEEAQVAGQLQHPGVIPIHDLGRLPDGRPYFVMKLVNGRTLSELLAARPDPSAQHGRFVQAFLQVCHTVAYAHSNGVLHRDLKPANVMLGSFGEVLVMDWGLAKVLRRGERAGDGQSGPAECGRDTPPADGPAPIRTAGPELGPATAAGSVLGTPGFMSPEQAAGEVETLDERADVFGLGAILCVILTGKPPYPADTGERLQAEDVLERVEESFARLDASGADRELVALCKRCLSADRDARPRHAGEVAAAVAAHLADVDERARQAEVDRIRVEGELRAARVRAREEQTRRRAQTAIAVTIAVLVGLGAALVAWQDRQAADRQAFERVRAARNAEAAEALLGRAEAALRDDDAGGAGAAFEQAAQRVAEGGADHLLEGLARCRAEVELLRDLDRVDDLRWAVIDGRQQGIGRAAAEWPGVFARYGIEPGDTPPDEAARRVNGSPVRERLLAALDRWYARAPSADLLAILRAADPDEFRTETREAHLAGEPDRVRALADTAAALDQPTWFALALAVQETIPAARRKQVLAAALGRRPGSFALFMTCGELEPQGWLLSPGSAAAREGWFRAAVAVRPSNVVAWAQLGTALFDRSDIDGAAACCRQALRLDPKYPYTQNLYGMALYRKRDLEKAIASYREAIRLDPGYSGPYMNLGQALADSGDREAAFACYREAVRLNPDAAQHHWMLGRALADRGEFGAAAESLRTAARLAPTNPLPQDALGVALRRAKDAKALGEAAAAFREAARLDPQNAGFEDRLGCTLLDQGDLDGATTCFRKAFRADPKYATAERHLGQALLARDRTSARGWERLRQSVRTDPKDAAGYAALGRALQSVGMTVAATARYREAIRLDAGCADALDGLASLLVGAGEPARALAPATRAVELDPRSAPAWKTLARARQGAGDSAGANAASAEARKLEVRWAEGLCDLAVWYLRNDDAGRAEALVPRIVKAREALGELSVDFSNPLSRAGEEFVRRGLPRAAEPLLRECLALRLKAAPNAWFTAFTESHLGEVLADRGAYDEAESLLVRADRNLANVKPSEFPAPTCLERRWITADRLAKLYESTGKPDQAKRWRQKAATYMALGPVPRLAQP